MFSDAVRIGVEGAPQYLPRTDEHQRNQYEKQCGDDLDRHDEPGNVGVPVFGAEKHLLRRALPADIDNQPAPGVKGGEYRQRNQDCGERDERKKTQPIALLPRGHAAARHPQE